MHPSRLSDGAPGRTGRRGAISSSRQLLRDRDEEMFLDLSHVPRPTWRSQNSTSPPDDGGSGVRVGSDAGPIRKREKADVKANIADMASKVDDSVNFKVVAKTDLYLMGRERSLLRVKKDNEYSCLMTNYQKMSSLFRHYAKYHGLRKETLEFIYTDVLVPSDTPHSVSLRKNEEIWVREKESGRESDKKMELVSVAVKGEWEEAMMAVKDGSEKDSWIVVEAEGDPTLVRAPRTAKVGLHRAIAAVRCPSLVRMMGASSSLVVEAEGSGSRFEERVDAVNLIVNFMYTASVGDIVESARHMSAERPLPSTSLASILIDAMNLSLEWGLPQMKEACEIGAAKSVNEDNVLQYLCREGGGLEEELDAGTMTGMWEGSGGVGGSILTKHCMQFIMENIKTITSCGAFQEQLKRNPTVIIPILRKASEQLPDGKSASGGGGGGAGGGMGGGGGEGSGRKRKLSDRSY